MQARLLDDPVALALPMVPGVFHSGRINQPRLRSRSGLGVHIILINRAFLLLQVPDLIFSQKGK